MIDVTFDARQSEISEVCRRKSWTRCYWWFFLSPMVLVLLLLYGGSHESYVSKLVVVSRFGSEEVMVFAIVFGIVFCVVYDHGCDEEMKMLTKLMGEDVVRSVKFFRCFFLSV